MATERRAEVVILRLNTLGGLVTSTIEIIADVLDSPIPIVGDVRLRAHLALLMPECESSIEIGQYL